MSLDSLDLAFSLHIFVVVEVSVYVRECGQDLSLFAIWNECVYSMRGGVVYILCGWSVVRPMASLTEMDSHIGDCSQPSREYEAVDSEKDLGF